MGFGEAIRSKTKSAGTLEEKLCESGNAEVQWKNIKECMLDTTSDLVSKVENKARKPWITQESKMSERRK